MTATPQTLEAYDVTEVLGRGAMGTVFGATRKNDGATVAIKTLSGDLLVDDERPDLIARFQSEAEIGRRLDHPGVVKVLDSGPLKAGYFLVMEWVRGTLLSDRVGRPGRPALSWQQTANTLLDLLDTLTYVHAQGVVHRDIKPSNMFLLPPESPVSIKLMDFGVARVEGSNLTQTGDLVGTPAFMSPEQLEGRAIGPASDLFSAGVLLYALLTGRRPFEGSVASIMHQVLYRRPDPPSSLTEDLPPPFDEIVARALQKDPANRYASATAFAAEMRGLLQRAGAPLPHGGSAPDSQTSPSVAPTPAQAPEDPLTDVLQEIAAGLADRVTQRRVAALEAKLETLDKELNDPAGRQEAAARLLREGLAPLLEAVEAGAPLPEATAAPTRQDFVFAAQAAERIAAGLRNLDSGLETAMPVQAVSGRLLQAALGFGGRLSASLAQDDDPDLVAISANLMRLDVLRDAMERLGAAGEIAALSGTQSMVASQLMLKVTSIIRRYTEGGADDLVRFSVASLLHEVEELLVLAERLVDPESEQLGAPVVRDFIVQATRLAEMTVEELMQQTGQLEARSFQGRLMQVGLIYLFAVRLDSEACRAALQDLIARVYAKLEALTEALCEQLEGELGGPDDGQVTATTRTVLHQLSAVHDLAERLHWQELDQRVMRLLRDRVMADARLRQLLAAG
ncbi:MAG: protein kinase domain-containing protein [Kiloniellales bacterium]